MKIEDLKKGQPHPSFMGEAGDTDLPGPRSQAIFAREQAHMAPGLQSIALFSGITGCTLPDEGVENERPIYIDIQEHQRPGGELGEVRDMVFRDITCESRGRIVMTAQDGARIDGVTLENVVVTVPAIEDPQETTPRATPRRAGEPWTSVCCPADV